MELRKGITGFRSTRDPPLPDIDLRSFRRHCFAAAHATGGRVIQSTRTSGATDNFATAILELPTGAVVVLVNLHFPILGFARPLRGGPPLADPKFVDCPPLASAFESFDVYEVISRSELEEQVRREKLGQLAAVELEEIRYWRPARVGDIVFNFWD
jgi:hypothetical protein